MKVCTDACLFGAWVADKIQSEKIRAKNILDIGTGTGLLSLMLAQKITEAALDAVEIDEAAYTQAKANFEASSWKERLQAHHTSIQNFRKNALYDVIISNPPFYENDLKSNDNKRNTALHSSDLSFEELLRCVKKNLNSTGRCFVLLPFHRTDHFEKVALSDAFFLTEKVFVKQSSIHSWFRTFLYFSKHQTATKQSELVIQAADGKYSEGFISLLKDYYLYL